RPVAPLEVRGVDAQAHVHTAGNAIDGAWENLAHSNGCNSVYRSAGERRILDGQNQFRSSAKCVLAISHKNSTGVSTGAFDRNPETRRRSDMSDDAERHAVAVQDRHPPTHQ